jgi:polyisoprenoid-binding protein YceI
MTRRIVVAGLMALLASVAPPARAVSETYVIDPTHTYPSFEFSHMGVSIWRGKFDKTSGTIVIDRAARTGSVDIHVDPASINFGLDEMDEKARSEDFFNVAKYPDARYKGVIKFVGDVPAAIDGEITLLGVTKPLRLAINSTKCTPDPMTQKEFCGADAQGEVNWSQFGMKWSTFGEGDAGKTLLRIQVEGSKPD